MTSLRLFSCHCLVVIARSTRAPVILISWEYGKLVQDEIDRVILGITRPLLSMVVSSIDK